MNFQEKYPRCFAQGESRLRIGYPDAWEPVIIDFFEKASLTCDATSSTIQIDQIKSKFGFLRIYYHIVDSKFCGLDVAIDGLIREAEAECEKLNINNG